MSETTTVTQGVQEAARAFQAVRARRKQLEDEAEQAKGEEAQAEEALKAALENEGLTKAGVEGVGTVYLEQSAFARVGKEHQEAFIAWLDQHGEGAIAKRVVAHQTLSAWYNEREAADQPLPPPELVSVFRQVRARLRAK